MIGAEQSCDHITINGIPIAGATHLFTAGLKIRRANTLNRCAGALVALCVERVFASIRKSFFSNAISDPVPGSFVSCGVSGSTINARELHSPQQLVPSSFTRKQPSGEQCRLYY